jgi:hypothetical protein
MFTQDEKIDSFVASGDLSLCINRLVAPLANANFKVGLAGASNALAPYGVLNNAPKDGENASVVTGGITMVRVGAAVQANTKATSAASGWAITAVQGAEATKNVVGEFLTTAASGMLAALKVERFVLSNSVA